MSRCKIKHQIQIRGIAQFFAAELAIANDADLGHFGVGVFRRSKAVISGIEHTIGKAEIRRIWLLLSKSIQILSAKRKICEC